MDCSGIVGFKPKMVEDPDGKFEGVIICDIGEIPPTLGSGNFIAEAFGASLLLTTGDGTSNLLSGEGIPSDSSLSYSCPRFIDPPPRFVFFGAEIVKSLLAERERDISEATDYGRL